MKFVHIADMHFDRPFVNLSDKGVLGDLRRLEQRKVFKKIIEYIKENKIEYFFIAGDLYEHDYVKQSTIEYINRLFQEIPTTKILITPGNHDPYLKNSYYSQYKWNDNVTIFRSNIQKVEEKEVAIYGFGFEDFYCGHSGIEDITIENKNTLNVAIIHGSLDGGNDEYLEYNPMKRTQLRELGFDYIALGHIHKPDYRTIENQRIVYPGSTVSLGFDELGKHGMIVGKLEKENLDLEFVPLDEEEFVELEVVVDELYSKEELVEKINNLTIQKNQYAKIILVGNRNFEINTYEILKLILNERIIKIKDKTKVAYDLEKLANENTLKGLFAKEMKNRLEDNALSEEERVTIEKAIEIGFEVLE